MGRTLMRTDDAPSAKEAEFYCTIGGRRYHMLNAKSFEATASVSTADVKRLGAVITGKKPNGLEIKIKCTVYYVSEMFSNLIKTYKDTGALPRFEAQVTQEDAAASMGRSTKVYKEIILDGDLLLSMFDADGEFIEQEIEGYAMDFETPESYSTPDYM